MADKRISQFAPPTRMLDAEDVFLINHRGSTSTVKFSTLVNSIMKQVSCCCQDNYGGFRMPRTKLSVSAALDSTNDIINFTETSLVKLKASTTLHASQQQAAMKTYVDSQYNNIKSRIENTSLAKGKIKIDDIKIPTNSNASGTRYVKTSLPTDEDGEIGDVWFQI